MMELSQKISRSEILSMDKVPRLQLVNSVSGFKSANLVGTANSGGSTNLAIFNSVVHIGSNPPLLGFIMRPLTVPRHTYSNIRQAGWFTLNQVHAGIYHKAHMTSGNYRDDISEFEVSGLTPEYTEGCTAPYVKESLIKIGLTYEEEHMVAANGTLLMVGAIQEILLPGELMGDDGFINLEAAETVAISGVDTYHKTVQLERKAYMQIPEEKSR